MSLITLVLAMILTTCLANLDDERQIVLHRLRRSLIEVPDAILDDYASSSLPCNVEGFYSHPTDCTKFYRCIHVSRNNGYMPVTFTCPKGTRFSSEHNTCISGTCVRGLTPVAAVASCNDEVEGCTPDSIRSFTVADQKLEQICKNKDHKFLCQDCSTMLMCINGIPYTKPCEEGSVCSIEKKFDGGICFPSDQAEQCKCKTPGTFQKDDHDPSKFLTCGNEGTVPTQSSCPEGSLFNEEFKRCQSSCTKPGPLASKDDCTEYFFCSSTIEGWVRKTLKCSDYKMFNKVTGQCEDPCKWSFTCESEGLFSNPIACNKFYACFSDPINPDRFSSVEYECPEGHVWSQIDNSNSGSCVTTSNAKCTCKIPKEWCDCPEREGFFMLEEKKQCFKLFTDNSLNWESARFLCMSEGLRLAEPEESVTVELRKQIVDKYGNIGRTWVGGRADGSSYKWASGDGGIPNDSNLWWPGYPESTDNSRCLELLADNGHMSKHPTHPYDNTGCSSTLSALCERVTG